MAIFRVAECPLKMRSEVQPVGSNPLVLLADINTLVKLLFRSTRRILLIPL